MFMLPHPSSYYCVSRPYETDFTLEGMTLLAQIHIGMHKLERNCGKESLECMHIAQDS